MENRIKEYVETEFTIYPQTEKIMVLREALLTLMLDKYADCRHYGMSEQKSFELAIAVTKSRFGKQNLLKNIRKQEDIRRVDSSLIGGVA
ncbi:MAG: hypothetical protein RSC52_02680 [Oscillospiraceae bacterium]